MCIGAHVTARRTPPSRPGSRAIRPGSHCFHGIRLVSFLRHPPSTLLSRAMVEVEVDPSDAAKEEQASKAALWAHAVAVASVKTLVPITLDANNYISWRGLFDYSRSPYPSTLSTNTSKCRPLRPRCSMTASRCPRPILALRRRLRRPTGHGDRHHGHRPHHLSEHRRTLPRQRRDAFHPPRARILWSHAGYHVCR